MGEFRALWLAQVLSVAGDQLARVALTLLVYDRTHSSLLAAITFAASVVPSFIGGITLSGLADRFPRRRVMIACDLTRVVLVAVMAVSGIPIAVLVVLLFLVTLIGAPFLSARAALYPDLLTGDLYVLGTAVTLTTLQFAQVLGFAVGGAVVGFFGVRVSLLIDAATFALSALIIFVWVRSWPAVQAAAARETEAEADAESGGGLLAGLRLVFTSPALRIPMLLGWLAAFYNIPEGVSAPLAAALGGGAVAVGLILAAPAFGATVGAIAFSRFVAPATRVRWMIPLAASACGVLVLFVFRPPLPIALMVLVVSRPLRLLPACRERFVCRRHSGAAAQPGVWHRPRRHESRPRCGHDRGGGGGGALRPGLRDSGQRRGRCGCCYRYRLQPAPGALIGQRRRPVRLGGQPQLLLRMAGAPSCGARRMVGTTRGQPQLLLRMAGAPWLCPADGRYDSGSAPAAAAHGGCSLVVPGGWSVRRGQPQLLLRMAGAPSL